MRQVIFKKTVSLGRQWKDAQGLIDRTGNWVIEPKYELLVHGLKSYGGLIWFRAGKEWGAIWTDTGQLVVNVLNFIEPGAATCARTQRPGSRLAVHATRTGSQTGSSGASTRIVDHCLLRPDGDSRSGGHGRSCHFRKAPLDDRGSLDVRIWYDTAVAFPLPNCVFEGGLCGALNRDGSVAGPASVRLGRLFSRRPRAGAWLAGLVSVTAYPSGRVVCRAAVRDCRSLLARVCRCVERRRHVRADRTAKVRAGGRTTKFARAHPFSADVFWVLEGTRRDNPASQGHRRERGDIAAALDASVPRCR